MSDWAKIIFALFYLYKIVSYVLFFYICVKYKSFMKLKEAFKLISEYRHAEKLFNEAVSTITTAIKESSFYHLDIRKARQKLCFMIRVLGIGDFNITAVHTVRNPMWRRGDKEHYYRELKTFKFMDFVFYMKDYSVNLFEPFSNLENKTIEFLVEPFLSNEPILKRFETVSTLRIEAHRTNGEILFSCWKARLKEYLEEDVDRLDVIYNNLIE